ncbi:MAG: DASH family cryptochrome [Methylotenera sp.]|nr:DASH family cryptochrome [Oligoflexia bacterium]
MVDNLSLIQFCESSAEGMIVWCPSSSYSRSGLHRKTFTDECVDAFSRSVALHGQFLNLGKLSFRDELPRWVEEHEIECVYYTREFACEEIEEERQVLDWCGLKKIRVVALDQGTLIAESDLPFSLSKMPFIFTDFRKKVEYSLRIRAPQPAPLLWPRPIVADSARAVVLPVSPEKSQSSGEEAAWNRLDHYFWKSEAVRTYKETRNGMLKDDDSTRFSPFLNQGCLSARSVHDELKKYERMHSANESTYWVIFELLWRDYFKFLSRKHGKLIFKETGLLTTPLRRGRADPEVFRNWCAGLTEDPFINANMRELNLTGRMSNRGRQNVASYLIHRLQLPWTWGAAYLEEQLIDYDPDLNWGNWLYLSGRGTDPRAREFNPRRQAEMYDPGSLYQMKWNGKIS